jgi:hypothetical protein
VEIAALVVAMVGLVLQGLQAHRESVKDDKPVVRGLIELYVKLDAWRSRGAATNSQLHAWLDPIMGAGATASPEEIQRIVNEKMPDSVASAARYQGGWLDEIRDNPADLQQALALLRVYSPDTFSSEQLMEALESRGDLIGGLSNGFARAAWYADRDALADLLNQADETLRLLNEGADMLRAFIRDNIPIEEYEALAPSLK